MPAQILDGNVLAKKIQENLRREMLAPPLKGKRLLLHSVAVGENPNSALYEEKQQKLCAEVGIDYQSQRLPDSSSEEDLIREIQILNHDPETTGIIVQRPLPKGFNTKRIQAKIHPDKDVEGMNPANIGMIIYGTPQLAPCTALAAIEITKMAAPDLKGKDAVVIGHSEIVGKPIAFLLLNEFATATICHVETRDLASHTRKADILYVAVGKPGIIKGSMVKPGAIVVDIGINRIQQNGKWITVGDVERESVEPVAGALTPVPGGVGPVTVSMLLQNVVKAAKLHYKN